LVESVSASLEQTNTKDPSICVTLVLVSSNNPPPPPQKKLTSSRGGNWC
jgi:hypothetical protein